MRDAVAQSNPELIICPYLKERIPEDIWRNHTCIIIHPGIQGDRGPSSLDWAIMERISEWGVTALQCAEELDAGDIWASTTFPMRTVSKSTLYRNEVTEAAIEVILETISRFESGSYLPEPLDTSNEHVLGTWKPLMKQPHRAIDWSVDLTETIVRKIHAADSHPGVLDTIEGEQYYLYGAHREAELRGAPGEIIAQRHGAICRGTRDGAVWISHLKRKSIANRIFFKLPATVALGKNLKGVPESPVDLLYTGTDMTFREIWYEEKNEVGYLHFDFYNGALSTDQCCRLRQAILAAHRRPTKVLVLMSGEDFWANGIHLNMIQAAEDPAGESWLNINAINDLVETIIAPQNKVTISAVRGNAAAGGVILALAADEVYAHRGVILNPHYRTMGLYGSEYWTYLLPKRVGTEQAQRLMEQCLPVSAPQALAMGLIDEVISGSADTFQERIEQIAESVAHGADYSKRLVWKQALRRRDEKTKPLAAYRAEELARMSENFYGPSRSSYHEARKAFVYKSRRQGLPSHLATQNGRLGMPTHYPHMRDRKPPTRQGSNNINILLGLPMEQVSTQDSLVDQVARVECQD